MRTYEPLTPEQRAYRYADVCQRAAGKPRWHDSNTATEKAIKQWKEHNAALSRAMETHLQWEADYVAGLK